MSFEISNIPLRLQGAHMNVTGFTSGDNCVNCVQISDLNLLEPGILSLTASVTHPFPGLPALDGYDVKAVILGPTEMSFPSGTVSNLVVEPDGYTARWSRDPWAELNPFIDYAIEIPERRFESDSTHSREIVLNLPEDGPLEFEYVIDVCWLPPEMVDPEIPSLSNHCNEGYDLLVETGGTLNPLDGSNVEVNISFKDWQTDGENTSVIIEAPGPGENFDAGLIGTKNGEYLFRGTITNDNGAPDGFYMVLIGIRDQLNNYDTESLAVFQIAEIEITSVVPELIGIDIEPGTISLPDTGNSGKLGVVGIYSDGCKISINGSFDWEVSGFDLNGNALASIDGAGLVMRESSRWWGGTAEVSVSHMGYIGNSVVYCNDPFADKASVTFGELNVEGTPTTQPENLIGPPSGQGGAGGSLGICSLGYGGVATLEFTDNVILNGEGTDFTVFENAFYAGGECDWEGKTQRATWNETASIEVSQDGVVWHRFPVDYRPDNITCGPEPWMNPSSYTGLGGNYPVFAGVEQDGTLFANIDPTDPETAGGDPFDLDAIGLEWCRFVRITDTGDPDYPSSHMTDDNGDLIYNYGNMSPLGATENLAGFDGDSVVAVNSGSPISIQ